MTDDRERERGHGHETMNDVKENTEDEQSQPAAAQEQGVEAAVEHENERGRPPCPSELPA